MWCNQSCNIVQAADAMWLAISVDYYPNNRRIRFAIFNNEHYSASDIYIS